MRFDIVVAVLEDRITARDALSHDWFSREGVIDGLQLSRFQRGHCHAFALRKDRDRQRLMQQQQQAAAQQPQPVAVTQTRKQGPR